MAGAARFAGTHRPTPECSCSGDSARRLFEGVLDGRHKCRRHHAFGDHDRRGARGSLARYSIAEAVARLRESIRDLASIQNILLVGGGAHLFKPAVIEAFRKHRITDIENPVFANVNGFQAIADEILARQTIKRATATQPMGDTA